MSVKTKMIKRTKKKTQCFVCGKAVSNLKVHSYVHDQPTECSVCGFKLAGPFSLKRHMDTKHAEKTYECYLCNKTFGVKYAMTQHIKTHNKVQCTICDDVVSESALHAHKLKHSSKFKSPICPLTFAYQLLLTKHQCAPHGSNATFQCTLCKVSVSGKAALAKHMNKRHSNTLPKCNICLHRHPRRSSCTFTCGWCFEHFTLLKLVQLHQLIECVHGPKIQLNDTVLMIPEDDELAQNVDMVDRIELPPIATQFSEATTTAFALLTSDYALERKVDDSLTSFKQSKTLSSPTPTSKVSTSEASSNDAALPPHMSKCYV